MEEDITITDERHAGISVGERRRFSRDDEGGGELGGRGFLFGHCGDLSVGSHRGRLSSKPEERKLSKMVRKMRRLSSSDIST